MDITAIADLLSDFDGNTNMFDRWEKQIRMLQQTYKLQEDACRILIGLTMRLKGKALAWFHSRKYSDACRRITYRVARYVSAGRKAAARKEFEARVWKKIGAY